MASRSEKHNVRLSKALSSLLRHHALNEGLTPTKEGWVPVEDVLSLPKFANYSVKMVEEVVKLNDKQRFSLKRDDKGDLLIRANQGHTIKGIEPDLRQITDPSEFEIVVHGTFKKSWPKILESGGLSRMKRNHIHFAPGLPNDSGVISGMRQICNIVIFIDLEAALQDGFQFFESENKVILSPGDEKGFLPTRYFKKVVDRKNGKQIDF